MQTKSFGPKPFTLVNEDPETWTVESAVSEVLEVKNLLSIQMMQRRRTAKGKSLGKGKPFGKKRKREKENPYGRISTILVPHRTVNSAIHVLFWTTVSHVDKNAQSHCTDSQNAEIQDRQTFSGQLPSAQCMTTESTDLLDVPPQKLSVFQEQPDETPPDEPAIPVVRPAEHQMDTFDIDTIPMQMNRNTRTWQKYQASSLPKLYVPFWNFFLGKNSGFHLTSCI